LYPSLPESLPPNSLEARNRSVSINCERSIIAMPGTSAADCDRAVPPDNTNANIKTTEMFFIRVLSIGI
jgi:hypothetical protein